MRRAYSWSALEDWYCPKSSAAHVGTCFSFVRASVPELQAKQKSKASGAIPAIAPDCLLNHFIRGVGIATLDCSCVKRTTLRLPVQVHLPSVPLEL